ncbi:MAG: RHS repeat-associated core domain-containing protein [Bacteroidales bacterium]|nr:RHS repeat-associated core domain-containing protein [Bacteroidales bacterium]
MGPRGSFATNPCRPTACTERATPAPPSPIINYYFLIINWTYTFSAKERDVETNLSYFGSRYYSSDLSIWLSVDPMSDKYASLSPYVYCANNPIKLVDPDGRKVEIPDENDKEFINQLIDPTNKNYSKSFHEKYKELDEQTDHIYIFKSWQYDANRSGFEEGKYENHGDGTSTINFSKGDSPMVSERLIGASPFRNLFEETYHAFQDKHGLLNNSCMNEAEAWKFAAEAPGTSYSFLTPNGSIQNTFMFWLKDASIGMIANAFKFGWKKEFSDYLFFPPESDMAKGIYSDLKFGISTFIPDRRAGLKLIDF